MSRKVYLIKVTTRLIINMEEGVEVGDVIDNMDYSFDSQFSGADIVDTEILDYEVMDSK